MPNGRARRPRPGDAANRHTGGSKVRVNSRLVRSLPHVAVTDVASTEYDFCFETECGGSKWPGLVRLIFSDGSTSGHLMNNHSRRLLISPSRGRSCKTTEGT